MQSEILALLRRVEFYEETLNTELVYLKCGVSPSQPWRDGFGGIENIVKLA